VSTASPAVLAQGLLSHGHATEGERHSVRPATIGSEGESRDFPLPGRPPLRQSHPVHQSPCVCICCSTLSTLRPADFCRCGNSLKVIRNCPWRREAFTLRTDSDLAQPALIRSGAGIGVCQAAIARRDEGIVRVLPKQFSLPLETWITMHEDLRNSPRCRVTFEALVEGLQHHVV
jgi:DNA-binding transcriptional LysR family regulator